MKFWLALACALPTLAAAPTAEEIMRRVVENQEHARTARGQYVYDMDVFVRLKRANGKAAREESRQYVVAPGEKPSRKLAKVEGRIFDGKDVRAYQEAGYRTKESDIDGAITDAFAGELLWRKSGFGPSVDWFGITPDALKDYSFRLAGEEKYNGFDVFRIDYAQTDKEHHCWRGEALIERNEMQPVLVTSEWACKIPAAAKVMLGINVQHVGSKVVFERFGKDVWFPVRCGGEMKLRVLFLYARTIAFRASNAGFRKADVQSAVTFESMAARPE